MTTLEQEVHNGQIPPCPKGIHQRVFVCDACPNFPCYLVARNQIVPPMPDDCPYSGYDEGKEIKANWREITETNNGKD